jgi:hypothetical protein
MRRSLIWLLIAAFSLGVPRVHHAQELATDKPPAPDTDAVLQFGIRSFLGELVARIHMAEPDDVALKENLARQYYKNVFVLWFIKEGTDRKTPAEYNLRGIMHGFPRMVEREGVGKLINYDDPMLWETLREKVDDQEALELGMSMIAGGFPLQHWVLQETRDPAVYKEAVAKFREALATIQKEGMK